MSSPLAPSPASSVSLQEFTWASLKIGCLGFGGPAGQIALMHRVFVDEKKWIDEARYLHGLNFCMLLPGPEAQQLATYVGWRLRGALGALIAGGLFVLPGALVVFALSWLYAANADAPVVNALFYGVKAAVVAFVAEAMIRIGRRALKGPLDLGIALAAFLALFLFGAPFPVVILAAAGVGLVLRRKAAAKGDMAVEPERQPGRALWLAAGSAVLWLAPLAVAALMLGPRHVLVEVGVLFSQLAVVTFGGAYALLAYLQQQAVDVQGWLTTAQMVDGLGLAETTPGPLVLVNQFVGFLAGWQAEGGGLALAAACALMASWCTFAPSFVWIMAGAPYAERLRRNALAASALASISAAVFGVIAYLALWFATHVIFPREVSLEVPWGEALKLPNFLSFDPAAALIALAAGVALIRWKANAVLVVVASALAGWAISLVS